MAVMGPGYVYEPEMLLGKWEGYGRITEKTIL